MAAKVGKRRSGSFTCSGTVALFGWVHRLYIEKDYTSFLILAVLTKNEFEVAHI